MLLSVNLFIFVLFYLRLFQTCFTQLYPEVISNKGIIRGKFEISVKGRHFNSFLGIRYGKPPEGKDRFKDPQPTGPWEGIWDAREMGNACLQWNYITESPRIVGAEDCLFLNVYTPKLPDKNNNNTLLDVIVYFHGGGFMFGASNSYGPEIIMDRNVVLVTLNYRLGPFGFLSTEDEVVPGNMGLKDQVLALKWIQENIQVFGGNRNSVTITGCSAGGASVHFHYLSPLSKGLFHKGISLSGTTLQPWTQQEAARDKANFFGAQLGCSTENSQLLIDCLRERPAQRIVELVDKLLFWKNNPFSPFGPVVEKFGKNPFISEQPIQALLEGHIQDIPWMTSFTSAEGLFPAADPNALAELDAHWRILAPHLLDFNYTVSSSQHSLVADQIRRFYFPKEGFTENDQLQGLIQMLSDRHFVLDAVRAAKLQASQTTAPVYFYRYSYRGKHSLSEHLSGKNIDFGSSHADDSSYVLYSTYINTGHSKDDINMRELFLDIWTNFASFQDSLQIKNVTWDPVSSSRKLKFLSIPTPYYVFMDSEENFGNSQLWDSLPINEPQFRLDKNYQHKIDEL